MDGDNAIGALAQAIEDTIGSIRAARAELSADLTLTTSHANLAGCNVTAVTIVPEIWLLIGTYDFQVTGAGASTLARGALVIDNVEQPQLANFDMYAVSRGTVSQTHVTGVLAPGTHTAILRGFKSTASGAAAAVAGATNITVLRIPAGA